MTIACIILSIAAILGAFTSWFFAERYEQMRKDLHGQLDLYSHSLDRLSGAAYDDSQPASIKVVESIRMIKVVRYDKTGSTYIVLKSYNYHNSWSRQTALVEAEEFAKLINK